MPESGAEGVVIAQGGAYGGWSVYATGGKLAYAYNLLGIETTIRRTRTTRCRPATRSCESTSPTTAAASARVGR